jgi:hypothetical protein
MRFTLVFNFLRDQIKSADAFYTLKKATRKFYDTEIILTTLSKINQIFKKPNSRER